MSQMLIHPLTLTPVLTLNQFVVSLARRISLYVEMVARSVKKVSPPMPAVLIFQLLESAEMIHHYAANLQMGIKPSLNVFQVSTTVPEIMIRLDLCLFGVLAVNETCVEPEVCCKFKNGGAKDFACRLPIDCPLQ
mmetsp:Transcript_30342/g.49665  ORF Transcript_30342/g.49665 Transcript_30342/m.49665 type:complete len:135 (-) Transcript_30342:289-693(-)